MTAHRPAPEAFPHRAVELVKSSLADYVLMVVRPPSDDGIEQAQQIFGSCRFVSAHDFANLPQHGQEAFRRRFDEKLTAILPQVEAQEIEPVVDVSDNGFLFREF